MIKIAHLYYDILNLYGEDGNLKALSYALSTLNIEHKIEKLTINDNIDFMLYDFVYIGSGTEKNLILALQDIKKYTNDIKKYIENDKIFLVTGNALDMFGKYIKLKDESKISTLDIFNFSSKENSDRIVCEVMFKMSTISPLIGFYNHSNILCHNLVKNYSSLFEITKTIGLDITSTEEGITQKNFFGTYIIGPLLVRNPELLKFFVSRIIDICNVKLEDNTPKLNLDFESKSKNEFIKNYYEQNKKKMRLK